MAQPAAPLPAQALGCAPRAGQLGVSRVVEIDTTRGPRFGQLQYHEHDFLHDKEVVLTFDDGPLRKHSRMVLDALAAHCTRATFYMVGQMAITDPDMVREIARSGHTIAIHTWSHRNLRAIGAQKAEHEIELGISTVQRALGQPVAPFFRFPYLADSPQMLAHLAERNFGIFSIDVDSRDFRTKNPREMQATLMRGLQQRGKGILLFHDIQYSTAHGIRAVLDELAARGYRVVHLVAKGGAATNPRYDALAEAEHARRNRLAAANPMAPRSVVWPMTPPGVPVEQYKPEMAATAARSPAQARPASLPQPSRPTGQPLPGAVPAISPAAVPATPPVSAPPPADTRPALRGTSDDDDWRKRVFQN
jgi:peptidoglycan/xylan/chitin deacetylase (PgdA/CDA1 family)